MLFKDEFFGDAQTCSNCLRPRDADRFHAGRGHTSDGRVLVRDSHPADPPTDDRHTFCDCGAANARDRHWDDPHPITQTFRSRVQAVIETLEHRGYCVHRKPLAYWTIRYAGIWPLADALAMAVEQTVESDADADDAVNAEANSSTVSLA